ncbi:MAG: hypothetical protein HND48_01895 [Chloroflexi bacterium]|nr:hypothetical protein [Chloroflexota bacterium]
MTYHVVVATDLTDYALETLRSRSDTTVALVTPRLRAVQDALADATALIARDDILIDKELLDHGPKLKVVGRVGAGLSGIDIPAASERGIIVTHTPGVSAIAAAEHTIALMLGLSRRLVSLHESLRDGYWLLDRRRQPRASSPARHSASSDWGGWGARSRASVSGLRDDCIGLRPVHLRGSDRRPAAVLGRAARTVEPQ